MLLEAFSSAESVLDVHWNKLFPRSQGSSGSSADR